MQNVNFCNFSTGFEMFIRSVPLQVCFSGGDKLKLEIILLHVKRMQRIKILMQNENS